MVGKAELGTLAVTVADHRVFGLMGEPVPVFHFFAGETVRQGHGRRQRDFALPAGIKRLHPMRGEPSAEAGLGEGLAVVEIVGEGRQTLFEGIDFINRQAGGEEIFIGRFFVSEGENGFMPGDDEGGTFPDGHADDGRAEKGEEQPG